MKKIEWTVQNDASFHGYQVETWKSSEGEWAFGYGTVLSGQLCLETLCTGFDSEASALDAAHQHCYESIVEATCESADLPEEATR